MLKVPKNIRHIIFDFDGTLVDSALGIISCLSNVLNNNNITPECELNTKLIGPPLVDMIKSTSNIDDADQLVKLSEEFKVCYDSKGYKDTIVFPGVYDMLTTLLNKDISLYIATNKRDKPTRLIIDYLSWENFFIKIYSVDMNNKLFSSKSKMISAIIKNEKLDKTRTLYVGDRVEDAVAAFDNKLEYIMVDWGFSDLSNFNGEIATSSQDLYNKIAF